MEMHRYRLSPTSKKTLAIAVGDNTSQSFTVSHAIANIEINMLYNTRARIWLVPLHI
jgi:hypothetical protein